MLGVAVVGPMTPVGRGYTPAVRRIASLADGRTVFVKAATNAYTTTALRDEQRIYDQLDAPFLATRLAFEDSEQPVMILEDLSAAHWPPVWREGDVAAVRATMAAVAATPVSGISNIKRDDFIGWRDVASDPAPFLQLGLVSARWLTRALPILIAAVRARVRDRVVVVASLFLGLLGEDLKSFALAIDRASGKHHASPDIDIAFWSASLAAEGGGVPEDILPNAPQLAALVSGFFAARAGLPTIPQAPRVRHIQQVQLATALPWAIRALTLASP